MIYTKLMGRLGNQMFQYAFARAAAAKMGTTHLLNRFEALRYFDLYPRELVTNTLKKNVFKLRQRWSDAPLLRWEDAWVPYEEVFAGLQPHASYVGYFQSKGFFDGVEEVVRHAFTVRPKYRKAFIDKWGSTIEHDRLLVVHMRRGDYIGLEIPGLGAPNLSLPERYFQDALDHVKDLKDYKIVIIGDDVKALAPFQEKLPGALISEGTEIEDFQLLMHADATIISNSTFAWWACYLGQQPQENVIAPKHWLGFKVGKEFPAGISDMDWTWIDVPV